METVPRDVGIDLYWLPLGAGGHFVRFNGRVYELIHSVIEHRPVFDLYHTALVVTLPEGRYVIENSWPVPKADGRVRGVTVVGPVGSPHLARFRTFRYEVRSWREGTIDDIAEAVASPQRVSDDESHARRILELARAVPPNVWGRDESHSGEMWNSNSVISWLLTRAGIRAEAIEPPPNGRAPGWMTGVIAAGRGPAPSSLMRTT
ncbi:MAG: hypothetical protein ACRDKT_15520 [Actinomycetota bacterium]